MAEYLVIVRSKEYPTENGPLIQTVEAKNLTEATHHVVEALDPEDGTTIDIYRTTSHKHFDVKVQSVTSLV